MHKKDQKEGRNVGRSQKDESITKKHGLEQTLKKYFPERWLLILSLVYFIVHENIELSRAEQWSSFLSASI